jgi:hypothetical protein
MSEKSGLPPIIEMLLSKLGIGGLTDSDSPEDWIEMARDSEPPHPDCRCMKCSFARGVMPSAPTESEDVQAAIVQAMEAIHETCIRSNKAGLADAREMLLSPQPADVEAIMQLHRFERYNASVKAERALNELLPPEARLPERMMSKYMEPGAPAAILARAREVISEKLAKMVAEREVKRAADAVEAHPA